MILFTKKAYDPTTLRKKEAHIAIPLQRPLRFMLQGYTYHQPTHFYPNAVDDDVLMFDASQSVVAGIQHSRAAWTSADSTSADGSSQEWDMMAMDIDYQV